MDAFSSILLAALTVLGPLVFVWLAWRMWRRGERRLAATIIVAMVASVATSVVLQLLTARPRPVGIALPAMFGPIGAWSFPSGHVALAVAATMVIGLQRRAIATWLGLGALTAVIAISRVDLGHHHPSDLLGGAFVGGGIGAAAFGLALQRGDTLQRVASLLWLQLALVAVMSQMAYLRLIPSYLVAWPHADRVLHFVAFGAITYLGNLWCRDRRIGPGLPLAIVIPFGMAAAEEAAQALSSARTADVMDLACDLAGMVVAWWLSAHAISAQTKRELLRSESE